MTRFKHKLIDSLKSTSIKLLSLTICLLVLTIVLSIIFSLSNNIVKTTEITYSSELINDSFNNFKIVQISDVHNKKFGKLSEKINELNPDIVIITGDLVDSRRTTEYNEDELLKQFEKINSDIFFIPGEMEQEYENFEKLIEKMKEKKIIVLENRTVEIEKGNGTLLLSGIIDSSFYYEDLEEFNEELKKLKTDDFQVLLSHRPELMDLYCDNEFPLVVAGHTHGGYIQIPFIGSLFIPNQGTMPKYSDGLYKQSNTTMIVSSGLGNGIFPIRLFNQPEIVEITLKSK